MWMCPCRTCYDLRMEDKAPRLEAKIRESINMCSAENGSNTSDIILAQFLMDCLSAFDRATCQRDKMQGGGT